MLTHPVVLIVRPFLLIALLLLSVMGRLHAAESAGVTREEAQLMGTAAMQWLELLDEGKYAENFAAASGSFRKDLTAASWAKNHASMEKESGKVVSRDLASVDFKTRTSQADDGKETITYTMKIKTTFEKKTGIEAVRMEKEAGEWKVADYSIETKL